MSVVPAAHEGLFFIVSIYPMRGNYDMISVSGWPWWEILNNVNVDPMEMIEPYGGYTSFMDSDYSVDEDQKNIDGHFNEDLNFSLFIKHGW